MPWEKHGGGYRKEGADSGKGGFVKNPRQYEKLKAKYGKERAAAITNSFGKSMTVSAFGVDHGTISKAQRKKPSAGRVATGAVVPGWHGAVAGKKGHKLRAVGNEYGGSFVGGLAGAGLTRGNPLGGLGGSLAGGAAGTVRAHKKGHYKRQK